MEVVDYHSGYEFDLPIQREQNTAVDLGNCGCTFSFNLLNSENISKFMELICFVKDKNTIAVVYGFVTNK